jgi:hypothetical protein
MTFLGHDIEDKNFLRYIKRFLIAGVMEDGQADKRPRHAARRPDLADISQYLSSLYLGLVV